MLERFLIDLLQVRKSNMDLIFSPPNLIKDLLFGFLEIQSIATEVKMYWTEIAKALQLKGILEL